MEGNDLQACETQDTGFEFIARTDGLRPAAKVSLQKPTNSKDLVFSCLKVGDLNRYSSVCAAETGRPTSSKAGCQDIDWLMISLLI
jgi:hypothetical protein